MKNHPNHSPAVGLVTNGHVGNYIRAARTLLGACINFPHEFAEHAARMRQVWFSDTSMAGIADAMFRLQSDGKPISVRVVAIASKREDSELFSIISEASNFSVEDAISLFLPIYQTYIEHQISLKVLHSEDPHDAASVQALREQVYKQYEPYPVTEVAETEDLEKWAALKFQGLEPDYPCKPALSSLINSRMIISYAPATLTLIAARPSMGKTHYLACDLINFARSGARGLFISADMSWLNVRKRMVGILSGVDPQADWSLATDAQKTRVIEALEFIRQMPLVVHDNVVNVDRVCQIAKTEHYAEPLEFVLVDHIQLMRTTRDLKNPVAEMTEISGTLKHLSKVLDVPVLAASQLSRAATARADKRPQLSDLRESGALEQDATVVVSLHRPEYYGVECLEDGTPSAGMGEVSVLKNQAGITGTILCNFSGVQGWKDIPPPEFEPTQFPKSTYQPMPVSRVEEEMPF